jgi:tetratricopeptide (TPR) repeat protein
MCPRLWALTVTSCLASVLLPAVARSQPAPPAAEIERRDREAEAACSAGRLDEGVRILAELFALTDDGNYIFNQARCYQKNGRSAEAVARFEMYLERSDADPAGAAAARRYIVELQPAPAPAVVLEQTPASTASIGRTLRIAGLSTAGTGLAALGAATYFGLQIAPTMDRAKAIAMRNDPNEADLLRETNASGKRAELLQWVFLGVGATAVTTGALLYYLGVRAQSGREDLALRVAPLLRPGAAGAVLHLTY